ARQEINVAKMVTAERALSLKIILYCRVHAQRLQQPGPPDSARADALATGGRFPPPPLTHPSASRGRRPAGSRLRGLGALLGCQPSATW
ncbi:jg22830, partial [Pararge aegeria aegeria]